MNLPGALLVADAVYLLLGLMAYLCVQWLETRITLADLRIVRRQEMFDWAVRYQIAHDELQQRRRTFWTVLLFTLLLFSALAAAHHLYVLTHGPAQVEVLAVYVLALAALDLVVYLSVKGQCDLRRSRLEILKMKIVRAYTTKNYPSLKDLSGKGRAEAALLVDPFMMLFAIITAILCFLGVLVLSLYSA